MKWNWTKFCDKIEGNVRLRYTRHSGWIYNVIPIKGRDQENSFVFFRALPESPNRQADTSYHRLWNTPQTSPLNEDKTWQEKKDTPLKKVRIKFDRKTDRRSRQTDRGSLIQKANEKQRKSTQESEENTWQTKRQILNSRSEDKIWQTNRQKLRSRNWG